MGVANNLCIILGPGALWGFLQNPAVSCQVFKSWVGVGERARRSGGPKNENPAPQGTVFGAASRGNHGFWVFCRFFYFIYLFFFGGGGGPTARENHIFTNFLVRIKTKTRMVFFAWFFYFLFFSDKFVFGLLGPTPCCSAFMIPSRGRASCVVLYVRFPSTSNWR
jgi:hypothetical protein